jgi:amidohydrolase
LTQALPSTRDLASMKDAARRAIEAKRESLIGLSHRIHAKPELGFQEVESSQWVADAVAEAGYEVTKPAYDLETAFVGRAGSGALHLVICAEYDALPQVGHACGHNIIATAAVGAAIGLQGLLGDAGLSLSVMGTPAEERGDASGKILLIERGAFDGVHAALMVHPAPDDVAMPQMIAAAMFDVTYKGKEAHAAAWPWLGVNAADALVVAQTAVALLRQQIEPTDRVHGIVTHGGDAPNIIPSHTTARYMVRSPRLEQLQALRDRVMHCFEAGGLATGAELSVAGGYSPYADVRHDPDIAALYERNAVALGRSFQKPDRASGSTDMGNVSMVVPSIHPFIGIESLPAVNHQPEFAAHCVTPAADRAVMDGAIAMAWTALDLATDEAQRSRLLARS